MTSAVLPGFGNQLRRETATWLSTGRWWVQAVTWAILTNVLLAFVLWVVPRLDTGAGVAATIPVGESAAQFAGMAAVMASVGAVILTQGILLDEREHGLLEWMLSKPVSRGALLWSKFVGHTMPLVLAVVVVPWTGVLLQLSLARGSLYPVTQWLGAVGLVALLVVFQLALVLAVSVLTWSRPLVVALPLAALVGTDLLLAGAPGLFPYLPWQVARLSGPVLSDGTLLTVGPLVAVVVAAALCLAVAGRRLSSAEL